MSHSMHAIYSHAWMQKHPSPTKSDGDFHWHPAGVPEAIRATLTELASRGRGHAASAWIIDDSYAAWARPFSAISPSDRRKYTGLAVTIARRRTNGDQAAPGNRPADTRPADTRPADNRPADNRPANKSTDTESWSTMLPAVFAAMPMVPAAPFAGQPVAHESRSPRMHSGANPNPANTPEPVDRATLRALFPDNAEDLARAVYLGGQVFTPEPHAEHLPALLGQLLSWIPAAERARGRTGMFTANRAAVATAAENRSMHNLVHYLAAAWLCPDVIERPRPRFARDAWRLVCELAEHTDADLEQVFVALTRVAGAWDSAPELMTHLVHSGTLSQADISACDARAPSPLLHGSVADAGRLWNRVLHYWGRGFLPQNTTSGLAQVLAQRIVADHLFHLDAPDARSLPHRYLRRLHYEALLSKTQRVAMSAAVARYVPSLPRVPEVQFGR